MKNRSLMLLAAAMAVSACYGTGTSGKKGKDASDTIDLQGEKGLRGENDPQGEKNLQEEQGLPEIHAIAYDESMETLKDETGADAFNHRLDHADSRYYKTFDLRFLQYGKRRDPAYFVSF